MADQTLKDAAEKAGISYAAMRKDAERNKIRTTRDGNRTMVSDEALAVYMASKGLVKLSETVAALNDGNQPELGKHARVTTEVRELGNIWANLPPNLQSAILDGIPRTNNGKVSGGNSDAWRRATKGRGEGSPDLETSDDPHFGHKVGYQHKVSPRWKRISESTWELEGVTWSWNGLVWGGGGSASGRVIEDPNVSPGAPASDRRPSAPSKAVPR